MSVFEKFICIEKVQLVREIPVKCKNTGEVLYYEDKPVVIKDSSGDTYDLAMCFRCGQIFNAEHIDRHKKFHKQLDEISEKLKI